MHCSYKNYYSFLANYFYNYRKWQKFLGWKVSRSLLGSSGKWGKVSWFYLHNYYTHGFPTLKNMQLQYERFNESFALLTRILLKAVISILRNVREYITDARVRRFQDDHAVTERRRATVEVSPRWNRLLTTSLLVSSVSYFLISWQKDSSPLLWNVSHGVNFQWVKV